MTDGRLFFPLAEKLLKNSVAENIETGFLKIYRIFSKKKHFSVHS